MAFRKLFDFFKPGNSNDEKPEVEHLLSQAEQKDYEQPLAALPFDPTEAQKSRLTHSLKYYIDILKNDLDHLKQSFDALEKRIPGTLNYWVTRRTNQGAASFAQHWKIISDTLNFGDNKKFRENLRLRNDDTKFSVNYENLLYTLNQSEEIIKEFDENASIFDETEKSSLRPSYRMLKQTISETKASDHFVIAGRHFSDLAKTIDPPSQKASISNKPK
ncbi:MAG: hypothetical protein ACD_60C00063G0006 [uncultured bacterium]|nr:MAG: hypothetical protein ACD_60C00063G0006 [uncultured bacterium]